jgi:hypothetical protein
VRRSTLGDILADRIAYIWATTEERSPATGGSRWAAGQTGRPTSDGTRPPHPALDLVRARLARMDYLAELEAAA